MKTLIHLLFAALSITIFHPLPSTADELVELRPYARKFSLTGFTRPLREMTVPAEVSGRVDRVYVDIGDTIPESRVVADIDRTFAQISLRQNGIALEKNEHQRELVEKTMRRYANLIEKNSTAQATYDQAVLDAQLLALEKSSLQAEKKRLQERLKRHTVTAPSGWRVAERMIEPGEYVREGAAVLRLSDYSGLVVSFQLTYEQLTLLQATPAPLLQLPDFNSDIASEISQLSPDFDPGDKKIAVELEFASDLLPEGVEARGGLRAILTLEGKIEENAYVVPRSAVIDRYGTHWLVDSQGARHKVIFLGTGPENGTAVVSSSRLTAGQKVQKHPAGQ